MPRGEDSRRLDSLAEYAAAEGCRAIFLRRYFGEEGEGEEEDDRPCGLCDDCGGLPSRNKAFFSPLKAPKKKTRKKRGGKKAPRKKTEATPEGDAQQPKKRRRRRGGRRRKKKAPQSD